MAFIIDAVRRLASDNATSRLDAGDKTYRMENASPTPISSSSTPAYRSASARSQESSIEYQVGDRIGWYASKIANVVALLE